MSGVKRYAEAAARVARRVTQGRAGVGLVVCASTEQATVGAAVAKALGWAAPGALAAAVEAGGRWVVAGLPGDDAVLARLNGSRDRLAASGARLVVVVSQGELRRFVEACGDVYATVSFVEDVPFEADASVSLAEARRQLGRVYERRFGRLDLRGLMRRSEEDVGWPIEALYQPLRARSWWDGLGGAGEVAGGERAALGRLLAAVAEREASGATAAAEAVDAIDAADVTEAADALAHGLPKLNPKVPFARQYHGDVWFAGPTVLLGGPGSGKSFFLRWCARQGVKGSLFGIKRSLPVLVPLAAFAAAPIEQGLMPWIIDWLLAESPAAAHVLAEAIAARRAVFLLDGLDEAGTERGRARCAEQIGALVAAAPGCPVLVTSRPAGFGEGSIAGARVAQVEPFNDDEIRQFLARWGEQYAIDARGAAAAEQGREEGRALAAQINGRPTLKALARTPLLLTLLALVQRMDVPLPKNRVELYGQLTVVLVERWNQVRSLAGPGPASLLRVGDAIRLLGPLALQMVKRGERGWIDETRLVAHLREVLSQGPVRGFESAEALVELFRSSLGLLVEQAPGSYAFSHSTLLEYFAARELVRGRGLERLVASEAVFDANLREVIRLAVAEVGQVQLDNERLNEVVQIVVDAARK
ncbi:MAG: NACHT domain-containing protein [bacterium]